MMITQEQIKLPFYGSENNLIIQIAIFVADKF